MKKLFLRLKHKWFHSIVVTVFAILAAQLIWTGMIVWMWRLIVWAEVSIPAEIVVYHL